MNSLKWFSNYDYGRSSVFKKYYWLNYRLKCLKQVKLIDTLEKIDKLEYELKYANELNWSCTLSDGSLFKLQPSINGNIGTVSYEERLDYCEKVKKIRLCESDKQVKWHYRWKT